MEKITEYFGSNVFNDEVMKKMLSASTYDALKKCIKQGKRLDITIANDVAAAMKEWAVAKGATHFSHWFQPLTGITAEKHESFISPDNNGGVIMDFSGKELIKGEGDASSFPTGGLRATFEARGYTVWDSSSYAFIKDNTLCIPTAFCSYGGEALDKKTPLLRSMEFVGKQAKRIIRLFGNEAAAVLTTVGPEQEYFLIDKEVFEQRPDLKFCGRTLVGAHSPKGQELNDHYYGVIKPRVAEFMKELDEELWKLGIYAKTEHNEVAPAQHELAPIFTTANISADHNQLTMEVMKKVAEKHGLVCLLHEKPFNSVNGSGKHNNWALSTDTGINLLDPGETPEDNMQFLLFLCAVIKAVDEHQDLLRYSVASAGNDCRLGAGEAPPAIISIFLGDELTDVLNSIEGGFPFVKHDGGVMKIGAKILPNIPKDNTDRNRTSPFAFTGNKFEFRMVGSSASISGSTTVLNTIIGTSLKEFADRLENAKDLPSAVNELIKETYGAHKRIVFNGDGYSPAWEEEAKRRNLLNIKNTFEVATVLTSPENIELFENCGVLNAAELQCRQDIAFENYSKTLRIEALTLVNMIKKDIMPAIINYIGVLAKTVVDKKEAFGEKFDCMVENEIAKELNKLLAEIRPLTNELVMAINRIEKLDSVNAARVYGKTVRPLIEAIRQPIDEAETLTERSFWPYPSYADLLFSI